jgi:carbon starvation protein CstA
MLVFTVLLLILVGAVFVYSPAIILGNMTGGTTTAMLIWVAVIFVYYLIATFMPIDKIIGKIYPLFAFSLIFMAVALFVGLLVKWPALPEIWDGLANRGPSVGVKGQPIFPCLFITIACGAISGFHGTQSPLMARCMENEKLGRPIFYGSMITEGIVALIWAAVSSYFFFAGGAQELGAEMNASAPTVVTLVSRNWLGVLGGILALLGVVAAPITSGDTALRSARLIVADAFKVDQKGVGGRLAICLPIFAVTGLLLWFNISNEDGFNIIWRYFGLSNQTLAVCFLATITVWLVRKYPRGWQFLIAGLPAIFMFSVCLTFFCVDKTCLGLPMQWTAWLGPLWAAVAAGILIAFIIHTRKKQ